MINRFQIIKKWICGWSPLDRFNIIVRCETTSTQLYKGFPWFTGWYRPIWFDFTTVPYGDSGQSGLALQLFPLFPLETIVTSNLIGQNKCIVQWKCFIQLSAGCLTPSAATGQNFRTGRVGSKNVWESGIFGSGRLLHNTSDKTQFCILLFPDSTSKSTVVYT